MIEPQGEQQSGILVKHDYDKAWEVMKGLMSTTLPAASLT